MIALLAGAGSMAGAAAIGSATPATRWMTEAEMRAAFVGQILDGHYGSGTTWSETYASDGSIDYREGARAAKGRWSFRAGTFCTFYDPPYAPAFVGGCWQVLETGANCYEFYTAGFAWPGRREGSDDEESEGPGNRPVRWNARGWRSSEPSTCPEKPSV